MSDLKCRVIQSYQVWNWIRLEWVKGDCWALTEACTLLSAILLQSVTTLQSPTEYCAGFPCAAQTVLTSQCGHETSGGVQSCLAMWHLWQTFLVLYVGGARMDWTCFSRSHRSDQIGRSDWDLGNLEAGSIPRALCYDPFVMFLISFCGVSGCIWECRCHGEVYLVLDWMALWHPHKC